MTLPEKPLRSPRKGLGGGVERQARSRRTNIEKTGAQGGECEEWTEACELSGPAALIGGARSTILMTIPLAVSTAGCRASSEALAFFGQASMHTFVYVDGFNLYYRTPKRTPRKWLDVVALFTRVLQPRHRILTVKYFTARVSGTPADPSKPQRQDVFLRALEHHRP